MDDNSNEIKSMKLYVRPDRIYDQLKEAGYDRESQLKPEEVTKYDSWHYLGNEAIESAIQTLGLKSHHKVLDIGSGIGGPARYLSYQTGCQVLGVELQEDACAIATDLTKRCGMEDKVKFIVGDFLEIPNEELGDFDFIVSWLTFLHIPDKERLFEKCNGCIKPGGMMYIEDFFRKGEFTSDEVSKLKIAVYCENLPTQTEYQDSLVNSGYNVKFEDLTPAWSTFTIDRAAEHNMAEVKAERSRIYGEETWDNLRLFYDTIGGLFAGGHFCGVKFVCQKE